MCVLEDHSKTKPIRVLYQNLVAHYQLTYKETIVIHTSMIENK